MNKALMFASVSAGVLALAVGQASAHVSYGSTLDTVTNQNRVVSSNSGYLGGLDPGTQVDSHNNRFLAFTLTQQSTVNFTITAANDFTYTPSGTTTPINPLGDLNPGYALFAGLAPNLSHDGASYAGQTPFATWSPFNGSAAGNDPSSEKWGEYRSNADFTLAADAPAGSPPGTLGPVSTLDYLGGAGTSGNSISGTYTLDPGLYSLIVGGNNQGNLDTLFSNMQTSNACDIAGTACDAYKAARLGRGFNIQFTAAPVPVPAAVYLFGSGLVGLAGLARRKMAAKA